MHVLSKIKTVFTRQYFLVGYNISVMNLSIAPPFPINPSASTILVTFDSFSRSSPSISLFSRISKKPILSEKLELGLFICGQRPKGVIFRPQSSGLGSVFIEKQEEQEQEQERIKEMTITPAIRISERNLIIKGRKVLSDVPDNVIYSSATNFGPFEGIFLGAKISENSSRHVIPLGTLRDVRFLSSFRFKLWWMAQKMGDRGRDIPLETQFLLVESRDESVPESTIYTVFLPLIEGPFRACLQGNSQDQLELCIESGDLETRSSSFTHSVFVNSGTDPFATITKSVQTVKLHLKSFRQRYEKKLPDIVDYFGWCTWDAFYQEVTEKGVASGLETLTAGGAPPKFVIIDDGWQSVASDPLKEEDQKEEERNQKTLLRLTNIKENDKFQNKEKPEIGIKNIVNIAKQKYGLKYVYVWHAITGYWGGVRPGVNNEYESKLQYPIVSPSVVENEPGMKTDVLTVQGLGLVDPKTVYNFYNELHGYLASSGVDGVKVDAQCILETLGGGLGGRVQLTKQYHQALDASVSRNFPDNGIIACMSHNTDALYCSKQTAVVRASDDFYPKDPVSHTIHIASVAYNSIFLGEFMLPDWDMFHSLHPAADYHGSARAISGGPIYVSDAPGNHNFDLLKKLVLPDGSILRPRLPGRPTVDCLFSDPSRDGVSLLKIWNMNKYTGILGVYNCQGAAWSNVEKKNVFHDIQSLPLTTAIRGQDVHLITEATDDPDWNGDCVLFRHGSQELVLLLAKTVLPVTLQVLEHQIFTVSPIKILVRGFSFAPIGLIDMYNSGGAIERLSYSIEAGAALCEFEPGFEGERNGSPIPPIENKSSKSVASIYMEVKGWGRFGAYSSVKPRTCSATKAPVDFSYDSSSGFLIMHLDSMPQKGKKVHQISIEL